MGTALSLFLWFLRVLWRLLKAALSIQLPRLPTYYVFDPKTLERHLAIYGLSGTGKSRLISAIALGVVARRLSKITEEGIVIFDVHGSFYAYVKTRLALLALEYPELYELIILIDPTNLEWTVRYDPLACTKGELPHDRAEALTDAMTTISQADPNVVVHLRRVLYHAFLTLILAGGSLRDMPRLFRDKEFRADILYELNNPVLNEFWAWFPNPDRVTSELRQFVDSTLNRVEALYNNPRIADFLGMPGTIDWQDSLRRGAIVLINADKAVLSEGGAYLFCALLMTEVLRAAFLRALDTPEAQRRPCVLIADEYAAYTNETIIRIITEARKYKLIGVFASQEVVGQGKNEALQHKILKLVGAIASLRVGAADGRLLLDDLMSLEVDQVKHTRTLWQTVLGVATQREEPVYRSLDEIRQQTLQRLIDLPNRLLYFKERGKPGTRLLETPDVPDLEALPNAHRTPEALEKLDQAVLARYGVPRGWPPPRTPAEEDDEKQPPSSDPVE